MAVDTNNISESIFDTEELDSESIFGTSKVSIDAATPQPVPMLDMSHTLRRRADIDTKQDKVAKLLEELGCEGVVLLMPAHVAWFTGGMNIRGLIADGERPGIYTNGRQRWLLASNIDGQRLFDEELDGLGFQLKEWQWTVGRALLLGELVAGKKFATDRPFPNMPLVNDRLRTDLRPLTPYEQDLYRTLGNAVVHALEATARNITPGTSEAEIAGQIAHRLCRRGVEALNISVAADDRAKKFRRCGFTDALANQTCVLQATGCHDGLYATASRTVCFGEPTPGFKLDFEAAVRLSALYRLMSVPGESVGSAAESGKKLSLNGPYEHEWRESQIGYGAGRFQAEELRKAGQDEKFGPGWPIVWQSKIGSASVVDTVLVTQEGPDPMTPTEGWPFKRIRVKGHAVDVPDLLVRV